MIRVFAPAPRRYGQDSAPDAMLDHPDLSLSTAAAYALLGRAAYNERVRAVAAAWPDDAPDSADEVRRWCPPRA